MAGTMLNQGVSPERVKDRIKASVMPLLSNAVPNRYQIRPCSTQGFCKEKYPLFLIGKEEEMFLRQSDIMVIVAILTFILGLVTGIQIRWAIP